MVESAKDDFFLCSVDIINKISKKKENIIKHECFSIQD